MEHLTLEDLKRLDVLARRIQTTASGRPWCESPWARGEKLGQHRNAPIHVWEATGAIVCETESPEVADYLAAIDPETVLRLTAALRSVMAERDRAQVMRAAEKSAKVAAFERLAEARKAWERFVRLGLWSAEVHNPDCAYHKAKAECRSAYYAPCDCGLIAIGEALGPGGEAK